MQLLAALVLPDMSLNEFNVIQFERPVEKSIGWPIEAEHGKRNLITCRNPVVLIAFRGLGAEIQCHASVIVQLHRVKVTGGKASASFRCVDECPGGPVVNSE